EDQKIQIRDNALEAVRQYLSRNLEKQISGQYYFEVKVHPHHILRENKMLTGAGADRMQTGMSASFGKTIGRAALVNPGQEIYLFATSGSKQIKVIRDLLTSIKAKLPCKVKISMEKI
ncbi:MAG: 50S ribosomal protein L16, partial [Candidatus Pacearchaeota archaeon]